MGGGLRNCVSYDLRGDEPVWFVELDGVHVGGTRQRRTTRSSPTTASRDVVRLQVPVPASPHSIDAQNLRDARLGFIDRLQDLGAPARGGVRPLRRVPAGRRAPRRTDRERVRDPADEPRPAGGARQPVALRGADGQDGQGGSPGAVDHPRPGAQLRAVRRGPVVQRAHGPGWRAPLGGGGAW